MLNAPAHRIFALASALLVSSACSRHPPTPSFDPTGRVLALVASAEAATSAKTTTRFPAFEEPSSETGRRFLDDCRRAAAAMRGVIKEASGAAMLCNASLTLAGDAIRGAHFSGAMTSIACFEFVVPACRDARLSGDDARSLIASHAAEISRALPSFADVASIELATLSLGACSRHFGAASRLRLSSTAQALLERADKAAREVPASEAAIYDELCRQTLTSAEAWTSALREPRASEGRAKAVASAKGATVVGGLDFERYEARWNATVDSLHALSRE